MAIARCEKCGKPSAKTPPPYTTSHAPVGHPNSGLICGRKWCTNAALVWLKENEERDYAGGERIFLLPTLAAKVQVQ
jgi:hypothetical protein